MVKKLLVTVLSAFLFVTAACSSVQVHEGQKLVESDFTVNYTDYIPPKNQLNRAVIIMPPTGGVNYIDKRYAKGLAARGAHVKLISDWTTGKPKDIELSLHQDFHSRAVRAIGLVAESFPKDYEVSLLGTSVGGLFSAIAASRIDALDRVLVIGAGVPVPEVIVRSDQKAMDDLKKERFQKMGFPNDEAYLQALSAEFHIDPTELPMKFQAKKLGMVLITKDNTVPVKTQKQLQELWNPELLIEINTGHFWGIVRSWLFHQDKIEDFLVPESV